MSVIANKTINYSIYNKTSGKPVYIDDTKTYKRPSIEHLTDTLGGNGVMGEIDLPTITQLASMEGEIGLNKSNKKALELFSQMVHTLEIRWINDNLNSQVGKIQTDAHKEIIKVIPKKLDLGQIEKNSTNEITLTYEIVAYNYIQNGESMIEIDKLNNVFKILGVDYAASIREAL